jgi:hypothetical protein
MELGPPKWQPKSKSTPTAATPAKAPARAHPKARPAAAVSAHSFLSVEDRRGFDKLLEGLILAFQPGHADEVELLVDAAYCKWRQKRIWTVETTLIEMTIAEKQHDLQRKLPKANVIAHVANAVQTNAETDRLNRRYEAQLHRQYVRNIKLLRELQADRIDCEPTLDILYPEDPPISPAPTNPARHQGDHQSHPARQPADDHTHSARQPDDRIPPGTPKAA